MLAAVLWCIHYGTNPINNQNAAYLFIIPRKLSECNQNIGWISNLNKNVELAFAIFEPTK